MPIWGSSISAAASNTTSTTSSASRLGAAPWWSLLLLEAAHDIGEVSYLDRSVPILEAICQFVGTPAISLVVTIQGRSDGTEAFVHSESIEARPGPPTKDVVDVYEAFLRRRQAVTA